LIDFKGKPSIVAIRFISSSPPVLRQWLLRGALIGLALGLVEGVFWWMITATAPLSLAVVGIADVVPAAVGPWTAFALAFIVLPFAQGAIVALALWSLDRLIRRLTSPRATV
jgi:hypothetical protein